MRTGDPATAHDVIEPPRVGNYMATFGGRKFWPLDPRPEEVVIGDIAHHLANKCRWAGATRWHYSVAQHSVYVSWFVPGWCALEALLHDASEAYNGDLIRPLKHSPEFAAFGVVEERVERAIARRFQLEHPWPIAVKDADAAVGIAEAYQLIALPYDQASVHFDASKAADLVIEQWSPDEAEASFLARYEELTLRRTG
jgi:hypothetical protein